ncbi:MAG: hypothetical protein ACODAU_11800 [Myxococcota bacterium]
MRKRTLGPALIVLFATAAAVTGCSDRELKPLNPCVITNFRENPNPEGVDKVDLLFVVDSSGSMIEEQEALRSEFPRLIEILAGEEPIPDEADIEDFDPVSLQVGVVSTDLGLVYPDVIDDVLDVRPLCDEAGDDAVLRTSAAPELRDGDPDPPDVPGCEGVDIGSDPNFLQFEPGVTDESTFATEFGCISGVGTAGCFSEMQLEAMLKALTPSDSPISFFPPTRTGQGEGGPNSGFIRDNSLLGVIVVSDEDDCSWEDRALWDSAPGGGNAKCALPRNQHLLRPISRYVNGLVGGTVENHQGDPVEVDPLVPPERLVFAVIAGIPPTGELDDRGLDIGPTDFDDMLSLPELSDIQVVAPGTIENDPGTDDDNAADYLNPEEGPLLASDLTDEELDGFNFIYPSCIREVTTMDGMDEIDQQAVALPPVRLVETARALSQEGAQALVTSICEPGAAEDEVDFSRALFDILEAIGDALTGTCLPRELNPRPNGLVDCRVVEIQPAGVDSCDESRGRVPPGGPGTETVRDPEEDDRVVCHVRQVLPPDGTDLPEGCQGDEDLECGWFYDTQFEVDDCPEDQRQRITFLPGSEPVVGSNVDLECLQSVQGSGDEVTIGSFCTDDAECEGSETFGDLLECNLGNNTCQVPCTEGTEFLDSRCANAGLRGFVCDHREELLDESPNPTQGFCVDPTCVQH